MEKIKEKLKNIDVKYATTTALLLGIFSLEIYQTATMIRFPKPSGNFVRKIRHFKGKGYRDDFSKEFEDRIREREIFLNHFDKEFRRQEGEFVKRRNNFIGNFAERSRENGSNIFVNGFSFFEKISVRKGNFVLSLKVPDGLEKKDVKLALSDDKRTLNVFFKFETEAKTKGREVAKSVIFEKSYQLPENDVTLEKIKVDVEDNILTVKIPIKKAYKKDRTKNKNESEKAKSK
ncbi:MAG: Hsp20/alpha crystallin family protein [Rickettsiales bacterium]|jgi:HSP20 family molecular chaperone IbpA|nr:Hsp20/alpha crystallin family protein [Rickettsiales bacterium]